MPASNAPDDVFSGNSLYVDVVKYTSFGVHRTATIGEERATDWLIDELKSAGIAAVSESLPANVHFVNKAQVIIEGQVMDCFPLWPPQWTGPDGVKGPAALVGNESMAGKIAVTRATAGRGDPLFTASQNPVETAMKAGAKAVLVIANGPSSEYHAVNAPPSVAMLRIPVALVPKRAEVQMLEAAERGAQVSLVLDGADKSVMARDVVGRVEGNGRYIVISTPKSGWFTCAGERGPGIAILLAMARWIAKRKSPFSYIFDANTGHEIGGLGIRHFLEKLAPPPAQVVAWMHLGSNIATWRWTETPAGLQKTARPDRYPIRCTDETILRLVKGAIADYLPTLNITVGEGIGEMAGVMRFGYRGFGVNGGSYRFFHAPDDTPENATAPELLEPAARALAAAIEAIENTLK